MKDCERSNYGLGIVDCKRGKGLEECPFEEDKGEREQFKREQWISGWIACDGLEFGNIKKHLLYEDSPTIEEE